jgi:hypothetical protein
LSLLKKKDFIIDFISCFAPHKQWYKEIIDVLKCAKQDDMKIIDLRGMLYLCFKHRGKMQRYYIGLFQAQIEEPVSIEEE